MNKRIRKKRWKAYLIQREIAKRYADAVVEHHRRYWGGVAFLSLHSEVHSGFGRRIIEMGGMPDIDSPGARPYRPPSKRSPLN